MAQQTYALDIKEENACAYMSQPQRLPSRLTSGYHSTDPTEAANLAPLAAQAGVAVPAPEGVVRHERRRRDDHEAVADPQRVCQAPQQLPQRLQSSICLWVPSQSINSPPMKRTSQFCERPCAQWCRRACAGAPAGAALFG